MILADKIIRLRRKNGWSQEELAEKMNVSRQAVSKWESAQTVPDLEKILMLGALFGVTTDYLLKDELESEEFTSGEDSAIRRLTLAEANEYLTLRKTASVRMAAATFLCIVSVIPLLILSALAESPAYGISENTASAAGLIVLFLFIAAAVAAFLSCSFKNAPYAFLDKEPFDTEYGVTGMVSERQRQYKSTHARCNMVGTMLCILSPVPIFIGMAEGSDLAMILAVRNKRRSAGKLRRLDGLEHVAARLAQVFAQLLGAKIRQFFQVFNENVAPLEHHLRALGNGDLTPLLKRLVRRVDRFEHLVLRAGGDFRDDFARGRVGHRHPFLRFGVLPDAADAVLLANSFTHIGCILLFVCMTRRGNDGS